MDIQQLLADGSLLLAIPVAAAAGIVSFASPCVLPLVPGYVSYMTGVVGAGTSARGPRRSRALLGSAMFTLGVAVVFVSFGALFGGLGQVLLSHLRVIQSVMGVAVIAMGLSYLGLIPGMTREVRFHRKPSTTVLGAFALGFLFALGWTPCIGPALATVDTLAMAQASAVRGAVLGLAFCLGLGLPFVAVGVAMERGVRSVKWLRSHTVSIMRIGGLMMVVIGALLVTGYWNTATVWLRVLGSGWKVLL